MEHRPQIADLESPDIHETGSQSGLFSDAKGTRSVGFFEGTVLASCVRTFLEIHPVPWIEGQT